ncbi:unnamed protein product [Gadus morhua 'NCC']
MILLQDKTVLVPLSSPESTPQREVKSARSLLEIRVISIPADARSKLLEVKDLMSIIGSGTMHLGQNTLTWVVGKMQLQLRVDEKLRGVEGHEAGQVSTITAELVASLTGHKLRSSLHCTM